MTRHLRPVRWRRLIWPATAVAGVAIVAIAVGAAVFGGEQPAAGPPSRSTTAEQAAGPPAPPTTTVPAPTTAAARPSATAPTAKAPSHFATLPPGATLPTGSQCATWVRATPDQESKRVNAKANQTTGHHIGTDFFTGDDARANTVVGPRVDGQFTGTTHQILRWAACKWGVDEDIVYAQAVIESWWRQDTLGDWSADATHCAPGRGLGVDGRAGLCPESFGILQNRYPYEKTAWPGIASSTAMNADLAYGIWRVCFLGYEGWLNTVPEKVGTYGAGDAWGCVGRWFSGRWHTAESETYIGRVRDALDRRVWATADFQEA